MARPEDRQSNGLNGMTYIAAGETVAGDFAFIEIDTAGTVSAIAEINSGDDLPLVYRSEGRVIAGHWVSITAGTANIMAWNYNIIS